MWAIPIDRGESGGVTFGTMPAHPRSRREDTVIWYCSVFEGVLRTMTSRRWLIVTERAELLRLLLPDYMRVLF